ncbi:Alcohol dehydrogenase [Penicillium subrubescens]|uniref:Alcohol dehydrogenase n=1 Tax=Penicillium subrubescens TaxID=1316194 RepID=A0A1Q5TC77_9EURO|nr:Alcohol dehydrogenase [Penicillium subrubescens]
MLKAIQFCGSPSQQIVQSNFDLPAPQGNEVLIRVTHSGICGSELHMLSRPLVLGHEGEWIDPISKACFCESTDYEETGIGIVEAVGPGCIRVQVGDRVGWGPINATCGTCEFCCNGRDNYCEDIKLYGFDSYRLSGSLCSHALRKEQWLFRIPSALSSIDAAPLMCGGGTVWAALMEHCRPFHRVGIVGIGGLGHLAIQFAAKIGCHVSVFSTTPEKEEEARCLGAHQFFCSSTGAERVSLCGDGSIDRLLITSSSKADLGLFYSTLHRNAVVVLLSVGDGDLSAPYMPTLLSGMSIAGSCMCSRYMHPTLWD